MSPFQAAARSFEASWLHGQALDWAWETIVLERFASDRVAQASGEREPLVLITEQDVFLTAPVSLSAAIQPKAGTGGKDKGCFISGAMQVRRNEEGFGVEYLHPSAIVIDLASAPFAEMMRFSPLMYNGSDLDTGGSLAPYFETLRSLQPDAGGGDQWGGAGGGGGIGGGYMDHRYVSEESCFQDFADTFGLPDVYEDAFLHVRRSSGRYLKPRISFLPTFCVLGQGLWLLHCISSRGRVVMSAGIYVKVSFEGVLDTDTRVGMDGPWQSV